MKFCKIQMELFWLSNKLANDCSFHIRMELFQIKLFMSWGPHKRPLLSKRQKSIHTRILGFYYLITFKVEIILFEMADHLNSISTYINSTLNGEIKILIDFSEMTSSQLLQLLISNKFNFLIDAWLNHSIQIK